MDGNILFVVDKNLNFKVLNNEYVIVGISLDYRYLILALESVLLVNVIIVLIKKDKSKNKK